MKRSLPSILFCFILMSFLYQPVMAQKNELPSDTLRKGAVKIFLDCQSCDINYTREQLTFVNFVRDVTGGSGLYSYNATECG